MSAVETIFLVAVIVAAIGIGILILRDVEDAEERRSREHYLAAVARAHARRRLAGHDDGTFLRSRAFPAARSP